MGEFELIRTFFAGNDRQEGVKLGIGDDCALLQPPCGKELAVTTDTLNEGYHFFKGTDPFVLGYRSLQVNLSDLAAMGAAPWCFTLSVTLPEANPAFLKDFAAGLFSLAKAEGIALIGGNTSKGPLSITISAYGLIEEGTAMCRNLARAGEDIYVTGRLGFNGLYVKAGYREFATDEQTLLLWCRQSLMGPTRTAFARELKKISRCAIDISDGVVGDLSHILRASQVGAELDLGLLPQDEHLLLLNSPDERIELAAFGGCDYELLFTLDRSRSGTLCRLSDRYKVPVTKVGTITSSGEFNILKYGKIYDSKLKAFEHF